MDTFWTFTIPMSIIVAAPTTIATIVGGLCARQWWKGHAIRVDKARFVASKERDARNERYRQKENKEQLEKEAEAKAQRRQDMPEEWRTLLVTLKNMSIALRLVYFKQCMQDKQYPKISVVGADHFMRYFEQHSRERRTAAAIAIGPHLDIGNRLSDVGKKQIEEMRMEIEKLLARESSSMDEKWAGWLDKSMSMTNLDKYAYQSKKTNPYDA